MRKVLSFICFLLISAEIFSQSCAILSKANFMTPDKLCSPVTATWNVSYTGVDDGGSLVQILYDWDDGTTPQYITATNTGAGLFEATLNHTYTSAGNICNYHPEASLVVNGVVCTSSSQQQIVTVWDDDNHNGGHMHINPTVYPICVGNSDNVRFQDLTQFNCVPPQENDVPNLYTRWIQWIYGTDNTMTGIPVTINGSPETFPDTAAVIMLPGPVTGSGVYSDVINVANDKLVGQYFQVTLRNWNYCNPYDDPNIPGPPVDPVNGDHPPVTTTAIILIVPYPDATIIPVAAMCLNDPPVTLTAHDAGGTWSGDGVTGNKFNPAAAGTGSHVINYTITTASGCSANDHITITVNPSPDATITAPANVCIDDPAFTLSAHDPGGVWSGAGVTGNVFNPSIAGTGSHIITYNITNAFGCSDSDQVTITVNTSPDATITPPGNFCYNDPAVTLSAHDAGGTWLGDGMSGNKFTPATAGTGSHVITYYITNAGGCSDTDKVTINVYPNPDATITSVTNFCLNDPVYTLSAHDAGGTWSGDGVTGNIFNPQVAGTGTHKIIYSLTNVSGCSDSDTVQVVVNPSPDATITPPGNFCAGDPSFVLTAHDAGGIWSGDGVTGNIFTPASAGAGSHAITYYVTNASGCSDTDKVTINVYSNPDATINPPGNFCQNDPVYLLTAHDSGGTWSGAGVTGNTFNPGSVGLGSHTVKYIITNANGCSDTDQVIITVNPSPDATINPVGNFCLDDPEVILTAHDTGGTWTGDGVTGNVFDPSAAGTGAHKITYSLSYGSCTDSDTITINVFAMPDPSINPPGKFCFKDPSVTLTAHDSGGTWSGDGITGNIFNPAAAGVGNHIITHSITNANGCTAFNQISVSVAPMPDASIVPVDTLCVNNPSIGLVTVQAGGIWSGAVSSNIFNPATEGVGNHNISYSITDTNGCKDSDNIIITVMPAPVVNINKVNSQYVDDPPVTLVATPPGGIFLGDGVTGNIFNPGTAGAGTHIIRYQTLTDKYGCNGTDTIHINVLMRTLPVALFTPDTAGCSPVKVQFVNKSIYASSYLWDFGDNTYSIEKAPSHTYYMPGEYIVLLKASNISGESQYKSLVVVHQNPKANFNVYPTEVTNSAQVVICSNYSFYNDYNLWKFGDGTTSTELNPWHKYSKEGTFNITLTVTSIEGCVDSLTFSTPVHVVFDVGTIKFPNAFVWNRTGPTGGFWNDSTLNDNIFRPHFLNVIEYNLKIFNRWGVLIYESNDLHKGWDGYFGKGNLALEGVYVWHATGRYADGTYFDKIGDVTFLH